MDASQPPKRRRTGDGVAATEPAPGTTVFFAKCGTAFSFVRDPQSSADAVSSPAFESLKKGAAPAYALPYEAPVVQRVRDFCARESSRPGDAEAAALEWCKDTLLADASPALLLDVAHAATVLGIPRCVTRPTRACLLQRLLPLHVSRAESAALC